MANERFPEDPYRPTYAGDRIRDPAMLDNQLQPDPELAEGPASSGRIAIFAVGIAIVLGAVFYGLNNTSIKEAGTTPTSQTAQTATPANPQSTAQNAAPPGMRDVTPHANTQPGVTTGAAPAKPAAPPSAAPTGPDASRPANPAAPPASK
jgi:hypothetical protein